MVTKDERLGQNWNRERKNLYQFYYNQNMVKVDLKDSSSHLPYSGDWLMPQFKTWWCRAGSQKQRLTIQSSGWICRIWKWGRRESARKTLHRNDALINSTFLLENSTKTGPTRRCIVVCYKHKKSETVFQWYDCEGDLCVEVALRQHIKLSF